MEVLEEVQSIELNNQLELTTHIISNSIGINLGNLEKQVIRIDSNQHVIVIREGNAQKFKIRILQILQNIKVIVYDFERGSLYDLTFNLQKFYRPMIRNSIVISQEKPISSYFMKGRQKLFDNLCNLRVINKITRKNEVFNLLDKLSPAEIIYLTKYLRKREILRLMTCNSVFYKKYYLDNRFWMAVYNSHFKKTGFASAQVNWRTAFFDKKK